MSIKVKLVNHYRVFLIRKQLIGQTMGGAGGSGSFKPPINQSGAGGGAGGGGHAALYGTSSEEIGVARRPDDAFYQDGFVHVFKSDSFDHQIFASLRDVHSVEFAPVYDETSL